MQEEQESAGEVVPVYSVDSEKAKTSGQQDFPRKHFPDKARKSHQRRFRDKWMKNYNFKLLQNCLSIIFQTEFAKKFN